MWLLYMKNRRVLCFLLSLMLLCTFLPGCDQSEPGMIIVQNGSETIIREKTEDDSADDSKDDIEDEEIPKQTETKNEVLITNSELRNLEFETFDNGLVSMQIPKGWEITIHPAADNIHYTFMVENPANRNYRIYFNMKTEGYLTSEEDRAWYGSMYPQTPMAMLPAIDPQTTEQFYKIYTEAARLSDAGNFVSPTIRDFSYIESLGTNTTGGDIIRAYYIDENDNVVDGIFTATVMPVSMYYVTLLFVYNTVFFTVPSGELIEWENVLNYCVGTITFSDEFIRGFYQQEQIIAETSANIARIASETSNIITSGWNDRQSSYDIISQKQSDATMGYERVYDTQTGEIYKASLGFSDYDWDERYRPVTDDMYNLPTSGYIERVD